MIGTLPETVLGCLAIPDCPTITYDAAVGTWDFWCGLRISEKLTAQPVREMRLLGEVHQRHHGHAPLSQRPWNIVSTLETTELSEKITVSCDCDA